MPIWLGMRDPSQKEIELCVKWLKKNKIRVYYDSINKTYYPVQYNSQDDNSNLGDWDRFNDYTDKLYTRLYKNHPDKYRFGIDYLKAVKEYAKTNEEVIDK